MIMLLTHRSDLRKQLNEVFAVQRLFSSDPLPS